jgi:hypothetical protein
MPKCERHFLSAGAKDHECIQCVQADRDAAVKARDEAREHGESMVKTAIEERDRVVGENLELTAREWERECKELEADADASRAREDAALKKADRLEARESKLVAALTRCEHALADLLRNGAVLGDNAKYICESRGAEARAALAASPEPDSEEPEEMEVVDLLDDSRRETIDLEKLMGEPDVIAVAMRTDGTADVLREPAPPAEPVHKPGCASLQEDEEWWGPFTRSECDCGAAPPAEPHEKKWKPSRGAGLSESDESGLMTEEDRLAAPPAEDEEKADA